MIFIGIDPGLRGAIAALHGSDGHLTVLDMPAFANDKGVPSETNYDMLALLLEPPRSENVTAVIEKVHSMPKQGVASTFKFGDNFGALKGILAAHRIPRQLITPGMWKKHFRLSRDKNASRKLATERFPDNADDFRLVKHDGRAEAALLALYAKETYA